MKVLTAAQMREVDRRTVELGIPGLILMENAGHRVVEFLVERFSPLSAPAAEAEIEAGDYLVVMGEAANLRKLEQILTEVRA